MKWTLSILLYKPKTMQETDMLKYIFLDIDGVLAPLLEFEGESIHGFDKAFSVDSLKALSKIYSAGDGIVMVLSSTWRKQDARIAAIIEVFKVFAQDNPNTKLDRVTFVPNITTTKRNKSNVRKWEVVEWILERERSTGREITQWVALDDDTSFINGEKYADKVAGHYVQCNPTTGLCDADADKAIGILNL